MRGWRRERSRAQAALEQSDRQLETAKQRAPEVDELVQRLHHQARINHFAERLKWEWGRQ